MTTSDYPLVDKKPPTTHTLEWHGVSPLFNYTIDRYYDKWQLACHIVSNSRNRQTKVVLEEYDAHGLGMAMLAGK